MFTQELPQPDFLALLSKAMRSRWSLEVREGLFVEIIRKSTPFRAELGAFWGHYHQSLGIGGGRGGEGGEGGLYCPNRHVIVYMSMSI